MLFILRLIALYSNMTHIKLNKSNQFKIIYYAHFIYRAQKR